MSSKSRGLLKAYFKFDQCISGNLFHWGIEKLTENAGNPLDQPFINSQLESGVAEFNGKKYKKAFEHFWIAEITLR